MLAIILWPLETERLQNHPLSHHIQERGSYSCQQRSLASPGKMLSLLPRLTQSLEPRREGLLSLVLKMA